MVELNKIYCEDCLDTMKKMPDSFVDLVVTSCPYSDMRKYNGYSFEFEEIAKELYRVVKPGGVVVWNVDNKTKDGSEELTAFKQAIYFVEECGFCLNDTMIWNKKNYMPQVSQPRYSQAFEYMFVFSKGKPKTFNPIKVPCKCSGKLYDSTVKNMGGESGRTHKTFFINQEKVASNVWDMAVAQNKGEYKHPAVFPEELATKHIVSWSDEGDVVYDPFMGSGTTAICAMREKRKYMGSEISEEYYNIINKRIKDCECRLEDSLW